MFKFNEIADQVFGEGKFDGRDTIYEVEGLRIGCRSTGVWMRLGEACYAQASANGADITDAFNRLQAFFEGGLISVRRLEGADRDALLDELAASLEFVSTLRDRWLRAVNPA